jgi:wyosine [tRNA(Phe)-imidazoG37] synthetase (radical SAM superfamily)
METLILRGLNDTEDEISGLAKIFEEICPDRVQLNTVVRPPAYSEAVCVDGETLLSIKDAIGDRADIFARAQIMAGNSSQGTNADDVMEMVKRRPVTLNDIMNSLKLDRVEAERVIKALMIKGRIREQEHEGKIYLISR